MTETAGNIVVERLRRLPVRQTNETWEVALIALPMPVQEPSDAEPWKPMCAVCLSDHGGMSMTEPVRPEDVRPSIALEAISLFALKSHVPGHEPLEYLPARIRIPPMPEAMHEQFTNALADLGITVEVKENLPILEQMLEEMSQHLEGAMQSRFETRGLAHKKGMTIDRIRSFAEAAAEFWQAAPWQHFESEVTWAIDPPPRTRALRTCTVLGGGGEEFGLGFFASASAAETISVEAMMGVEPGRPSGTIWSMLYIPPEQAPSEDATLWEEESLPLAAPEALPLPIGWTEAGRMSRPKPEQLTLMEALLRGFAQFDRAQAQRDQIEFTVRTFEGPQTYRLRCVLRR